MAHSSTPSRLFAPCAMLALYLVAPMTMQATPSAAIDNFVGANAAWAPASAAIGETGNVDAVFDGLHRLGVTVVRVWAFQDRLPSAPGSYDESQFRGVDYVVAAAARRGLKLVVSLGNFWKAGLGPEKWLGFVGEGGDVASFYRSAAVRAAYKQHLVTMVSRANSLTGVAYKDDPTILGWDFLNEPRCPGCSSDADAAHLSWMGEMAGALKGAAPNQQVWSSTEGYFNASSGNVAWNPGAGAACEGEDFVQVNSVANIDVATAHIYYRQVEGMKALGWQKPGFDWYANFLSRKVDLYTSLAAGLGRPLVIEEFGLTTRFFGQEERKIVFSIVLGKLVQAKRNGADLKGAMFWNAAKSGMPDNGGYNVNVDVTPSGASGLLWGVDASVGGAGGAATNTDRRRRGLKQLIVDVSQDTLDAFRRGGPREACANAAAASWGGTDPGQVVDVAALRARLAGHDIVDIVAEAARLLNS